MVGANLRRLRSMRGLSLERLARRAGVSRAMLSQTELGRSAPTINLLWKVARALDVTFAALVAGGNETTPVVLPAREGKLLTNQDGTFTSRALFPLGERRHAEFYELRVKARGEEIAHPHPAGTVENLVVASGTVDVDVDGAGAPVGSRRRLPVQRRRAPFLPQRRRGRGGDVPGDHLRQRLRMSPRARTSVG